ncbi:BrxA/BrxB family bacilliredoxin [Streptomyces malaysiense]|nr:BrxA/BrxB family bacilliredoxin [Streptomyces malaysiense]
MSYSPLLVKPMREELTSIGFKELLTPLDVDAAMQDAQRG